MQKVDDQDITPVVIAVMGVTGTGKSTFIHHLTGDNAINIGHGPTSETSTIQTAQYVDQKTGRTVVLIDTPGFDDSRGVTDTDILEMISLCLGPKAGPRPQLNGLIYMHRISDPRVGGTSLKNLRMFRALCGDENLVNVRIVTTNWSRVGEQEGKDREEALANETFKPLLDGRAKMLRHDNNLGSAEEIISELIHLPPITTQLERELNGGKKFNETSAGAVLAEEMTKMQEKHAEELDDLQKWMGEAEKANDRAWKEELEQERRELQHKMAKAESDRRRLERTLAQVQREVHSQLAKRQPDARTQTDHVSLPGAWHDGRQPVRAETRQREIGPYSYDLQGRERHCGEVHSPLARRQPQAGIQTDHVALQSAQCGGGRLIRGETENSVTEQHGARAGCDWGTYPADRQVRWKEGDHRANQWGAQSEVARGGHDFSWLKDCIMM